MSESTTTPTRQVEIYVSSSRARKVIESNATTWGELREQITRETNIPSSDLDTENSKIFEGNQRAELISSDTQLPTNIRLEGGVTTNNLLIVVTPKAKVKSGVTASRPALYAEVRKHIANHGEVAKKFFFGYTNYSSVYLAAQIVTFKKKYEKPAPVAKPKLIIEEVIIPKKEQINLDGGVRISRETISMVAAAFNLMAQAMELIKQSGMTQLVNIQVDPSIDKLEAIAKSLTGRG